MPIQIRRATLGSDRAKLRELFRKNLPRQSDESCFEWSYRSSPHGEGLAWIALDEATGAVVGAAAAFPRRMLVDGGERFACVLGDFCMDEGYRSLGPALQLQRACLATATAPPFEFCYDFPSKSMMAIYQRLGIKQAMTLVRWAKPLRAEPKLEKLTGSRILARGLGAIVNARLAWQDQKGDKGACDLILHRGHCGKDFSALNRRVGQQKGVFTDRSAEYLNWRYLACPNATYEILEARRGNALIGYAVFTREGEDAEIADLCTAEGPAVIARLLAGTVGLIRESSATTVSMNAGDLHPWSSLFEGAGFRQREASPVVLHWHPRAGERMAGLRERWSLMQGERDG